MEELAAVNNYRWFEFVLMRFNIFRFIMYFLLKLIPIGSLASWSKPCPANASAGGKALASSLEDLRVD